MPWLWVIAVIDPVSRSCRSGAWSGCVGSLHSQFSSLAWLRALCPSVHVIWIEWAQAIDVYCSVVANHTTIKDIYHRLSNIGLVPRAWDGLLYFTASGRLASWQDSMTLLNLGPLAHLQARILVPGGADTGMIFFPKSGSVFPHFAAQVDHSQYSTSESSLVYRRRSLDF